MSYDDLLTCTKNVCYRSTLMSWYLFGAKLQLLNNDQFKIELKVTFSFRNLKLIQFMLGRETCSIVCVYVCVVVVVVVGDSLGGKCSLKVM